MSAALLLLACGRAPEPDAAPIDTVAVPAETPPRTAADPVVLTAAAAAEWRLRELQHVPRYFQLRGWKDATTLFGKAGCNPVEVRADAPEFAAWDVQACGDAVLAPDRRRLAWGDGRGAIRIGERGGPPRLVLDAGMPAPAGEGDPTGLILWSPDGLRILTSWAAEWESSYAIVDAAAGTLTPLSTHLDGYFLTSAWDWLDPHRILFTAQASRALDGTSEYRESGGYRTDLTVYDVRTREYRRVTTVGDSVHLRPLGRWRERDILVGEARSAGRIERYWAYDVDSWSRRPVPALPAGTDALVADSTRVLVIDAGATGTGDTQGRLLLWRSGAAMPLADLRGAPAGIAWSTDGRRLAIATAVDLPVAGAPGSFLTRYVAYVLEPK